MNAGRLRAWWLIAAFAAVLPGVASGGANVQDVIDRAALALVKNKVADAARLSDTAQRLEPANPAVINLAGVIHLRRTEYAAAENKFREAIKADDNYLVAKLNLADALIYQHKYAESRDYLQQLKKADPKSELVQFKVVVSFVLEGLDTGATIQIDQMDLPGNTPAYYYARAAVHLKHQEKKDADRYLATARKYYSESDCDSFLNYLQGVGLLAKGKKT